MKARHNNTKENRRRRTKHKGKKTPYLEGTMT
jgi:hypothetical protein